MADFVELMNWPAAPNCLTWSDDSDIAVALKDHVSICVPKLSLSGLKKARSKLEWQLASIPVNLFSPHEWPMFQPRPDASMSIGEEQSNSEITALAWSPAGLGRHDRCALAVLTSNHVLSIWASDGTFTSRNSWKRVLVVNQALRSRDLAYPDQKNIDAYHHAVRALQIRSFSWSPRMLTDRVVRLSSGDGAKIATNRFLIAVTTDAGVIVVLEIQSPYQSIDQGCTSWNARVVAEKQVMTLDDLSNKPLRSRLVHFPRFATNVAWSHCIYSDYLSFKHGTILAYVARGQLLALTATLRTEPDLKVEFAEKETSLGGSHRGPLHFVKDFQSGAAVLIYVIGEKVHQSSLSICGVELNVRNTCTSSLISPWDTISGLAFTHTRSHGTHQLHIGPHFWPSSKELKAYRLGKDGNLIGIPPQWVRSLASLQMQWGLDKEVGDKVLTRIWGLAASPSGHCVATCFSHHPSEILQMFMRNEQEAELGIIPEAVGLGLADEPPLGGRHLRELASESTLLALLKTMRDADINADTLQRLPLTDDSRVRFGCSIPPSLRYVFQNACARRCADDS